LIYSLLDGANQIVPAHLRAALSLWDYADASARYIFGDSLGDPDSDTILNALRSHPEGLSRTHISGLFHHNKPASEIARALALLVRSGKARCELIKTGRRGVERWMATSVFS
jgi:hypothetical protein